jgi:hypothetical protein
MSIEKKSLISNRTATKKAIVTKPEVTKVSSPRATVRARTTVHARATVHARLASPAKVFPARVARIATPRLRTF